MIVFWIRQHDWLQSVLPPKTARARSEAFRDSPKPCSYQRAKHVNTSPRRRLPLRVATTTRCRVQLRAVRRFRVRRSSDVRQHTPTTRRAPQRAAVQPRVLRSTAPPRSSTRRRHLASDARQHLRRRASVHGSFNTESLVAQPRARQNDPDPEHSTFENNRELPEQFQFPEQSPRSNNCSTVVQENTFTEQ